MVLPSAPSELQEGSMAVEGEQDAVHSRKCGVKSTSAHVQSVMRSATPSLSRRKKRVVMHIIAIQIIIYERRSRSSLRD